MRTRKLVQLLNPIELIVALSALVSCITGLAAGSPEGAVLGEVWPLWGVTTFYAALGAGGLLTMFAMTLCITKYNRPNAALWSLGLITTGLAWGTYGVGLLTLGSNAGIIAGWTFVGLALACVWRAWQVTHPSSAR